MKIDKSTSPIIQPSVNEAATRAPAAKTPTPPLTPQGVSVSLGSTTNQLRGLEGGVTNTPSVDAKKVADIKQAISEGRFQINSAAIADSLINDVNDLIGAEQR
jgi:negative regulator of flagellin synthesis FlgM